jgi:hypothetical protein
VALWLMTLGTGCVIVPVTSPGPVENVNLEIVIMIPFSASSASLVRIRSREFSLRQSYGASEGTVAEEGWDGRT